MTQVNALIAMKESTISTVRSLLADYRAAVEAGTEPTVNQRKANAVFKIMKDAEYLFKKVTVGADKWSLFDILIDHNLLARIDSEVPGTVVAGAWNPDGTLFGQTLRYDEETGAEIITGTPVYPLHARLVEFMPRGALEQVHQFSGWKKRRWS